MPFLSGNLTYNKWKHRFSDLEGNKKSKPVKMSRGVSAPPELDSGRNHTTNEFPIVKQISDGATVYSPKSLEHEEVVTMPEPSPAISAVQNLQTPIPHTLASVSGSNVNLDSSAEHKNDADELPVAIDPVQMLVVTGVAARIQAGPKSVGKRESAINRLGDKLERVQIANSIVDASAAMQAVESGLKSFMEDIPWLMKGLDEAARIHPVVTVAVLAFKAVYTMEMTRRENDKRIKSLYVEMKDMIAVLVQLRDIKDPQEIGPGGIPIASRLQGIAEKTAADIKDCANTCDTYAKKRLVVKVLKGPIWESKLVGFIAVFSNRRAQFEEALAIHMARAVDKVQSTVYVMKTKLDSIDEKLALFNQIFQKFLPLDEAKVAERIKGKGDIKTIQKNDALLRDLNDFENSLEIHERGSKRSAFSSKDLRDELQEDFESAITTNLETFEGKFVLYQRQLREELSKFIHDENDRLLVAVREGPHDRIRNDDLREIWKEMNWRRNVKAKLFVLTLRDHFRDELHDVRSPTGDDDSSDDDRGTDDWAFEYLGLNWLQHIMEAFDEDGSGYVTVAEINRLTESMPPGLEWSLQHWIAYWSIGWELVAVWYANAIHELFAAMFEILPLLLPRNRYWADYYLDRVWPFAAELTLALRKRDLPDLLYKFRPYMLREEERIRSNLRDIRYDIDALDTVHVVAGPGRVETHVLPLLYLLLKRDLQIFRLGTKLPLNSEELWDCVDSVLWVQRAVEYRVDDLTNRFQQQQLNADERFQNVACEMLNFIHNGALCWELSKLQTGPLSTLEMYTYPVSWYSSVLQDEMGQPSEPASMRERSTSMPMPVSEPSVESGLLLDAANAEPDASSIRPASMMSAVEQGAVPTAHETNRLKRHLNYPLDKKPVFDILDYDSPANEMTTVDMEAPVPLQSLLGQWNGYLFTESEFPWSPMWQLTFHASPPKESVALTSPSRSCLDIEQNVLDTAQESATESKSLTALRTFPSHPVASSSFHDMSSPPSLPPSTSSSTSASSVSLSQLRPLPPFRSPPSSPRSFSLAPSGVSCTPSAALNGPRFEARGRDLEAVNYEVEGECYLDPSGIVCFNFVMSFPGTTSSEDYWSGHIDEQESLVGYKGWHSQPSEHSYEQMFILRRTPSDIMALRPSPAEFTDNKPRSLWQFAINTTIYQVRKRSWSWSFFNERRKQRQRYLILNLRYWSYGRRPEGAEFAEFLRTRKALLPEQKNLIRSMRDYLIDTWSNHFELKCMSCGQDIGAQRLMCLDCRPEVARIRQTVNFCDHFICGEQLVTSETFGLLNPKKPHLPTHNFVKLRDVLHLKDMPFLDRQAAMALERSISLFKASSPNGRSASAETVMDGEAVGHTDEGAKLETIGVPVEDATQDNATSQTYLARSSTLFNRFQADDSVPALGIVRQDNPEPPSGLRGLRQKTPKCYTCVKLVSQPCWYCILCDSDVFICDDCEASHSLPCRNCRKPYVQPLLGFFGQSHDDNFLCNVCDTANTPLNNCISMQHIFSHPLVRCKEQIYYPEDPAPPTTDERLANLEERVLTIDHKLDYLQGHIETMFTRLEQKLLDSFVPKV